MRITFKCFDSKMASREKLFKAAVDYANKLDPKQLINVTHSEDRDNIVITIWFWTDEPDKAVEIKAKQKVDLGRVGTDAIIGGDGAPPPGRAGVVPHATPTHAPGLTQPRLPIEPAPRILPKEPPGDDDGW